jgi:hypothetical protein
MFLRSKGRFKNGKWHRYWSVVENRRLAAERVVQRQVLYLGEINDDQEAAWRKSLEVLDEQRQQTCQMSLFPEDRQIPADAVNALSLRMTELRLHRARAFGDCWLGLTLWRQLGLDRFWANCLADQPGDVPWEQVLAILAINRLVAPASEWHVHREWFLQTALDELLGVDFAAVAKDRLYRCLDRLVAHKDGLHRHLVEQWRTLFDAKFDILLYDLTSTYFEGQCKEIPKARHGYSRDGRPDCRQVVIALVVTPDGLPLAYEVLAGNTSDKTTLKTFLDKIESLYGKADRIWVMDRGVPTEEVLRGMRTEGVHYMVGTPKSRLSEMESALLDRSWCQVHEGLQVKLLEQEGEVYVLARSEDRRQKEQAIHRRKLKRLVKGLNDLKRRAVSRDVLLQKIGGPAGPGRTAQAVREDPPAPRGRGGDALHVPLFVRLGGLASRARPGRGVSAARLPAGRMGRRWGKPLADVHAIGPGRAGLPALQDGSGDPSDRASVGSAGGGAHPGGVPGVRPAGESADEIAARRVRTDAPGSAGETGGDPDGGRVHPDDRWSAAGDAAVHRAGGRPAVGVGQVEPAVAAATPAADPLRGGHPAGGACLL